MPVASRSSAPQRADTTVSFLEYRDPGLLQLANSLGKPAQSVACAADGALNTRNEFTHPGSVAAMDQEVSEMMELITPPELEDKCPEECMFLTAYEDIKNAFPHRFSQVGGARQR
ncbi:hypothetical protein CHLRE_11g467783v5 [Chlamydomonas reinhardtii]|uniref:Uncharacterized protein n=1 Tax=Chlamydomonas reinhardtii TaxID=3055 RepID=A0A2K3D805_CHLRE|nr:uncharacterized protein CHLRE_11g467783v5 [Chlamydomonas reinhardtii]PNW76663.1 hypothetical protein CHLRE_11g467783v5 [Chlamydomonas reinhardtii]